MREDFVNETARILGIARRDLVEKDLIIHQMLADLANNDFFSSNFLFKGGTCLIKSYFGYVRFSEDIDFTWKDQKTFADKSQKAIRSYLSKIIDRTGRVFEEIASKRELDFKLEKRNPDYIEFGGGNKSCTLKVWYTSEILKRSFIKVQINFVEKMCYKHKKGRLNSLLTKKHAELEALFPQYMKYSKPINFSVYDIREILSEKVRALMTREGTKARDFLDIYFIDERFGVKPQKVETCIVEKMNFALKLYKKYRTNLKEKIALLNSESLFEWDKERDLLLIDIDEREFYSFLAEFQDFLKKVIKELRVNR